MKPEEYLSMPTFHLSPTASATETDCLFLQRLKKTRDGTPVKQGELARDVGIDSTQFSRIVNGELGFPYKKIPALIEAMGLVVRDKEDRMIDPRDFEALARMAGLMLMQAPHTMLKG